MEKVLINPCRIEMEKHFLSKIFLCDVLTMVLRKVNYLILLVLLFAKTSCRHPDLDEIRSKNETKQDRTNNLVFSLQRELHNNNYGEFFLSFPNTYEAFVKMYGYNGNDSSAKSLYTFYSEHINYFFQYEGKIEEERFIEKVFNIAHGPWDADAVDLFQQNLYNLILNKPQPFIRLLNTKTGDQAQIFWRFIFDGSPEDDLQNKQQFQTMYIKINVIDSKQAQLLKSTFENLYRQK